MKIAKLGLEIRKIGQVSTLYADVDLVLQQYGVPRGEVTRTVQALTAAHALQKMLNVSNCFSVCTVRECAVMCQVCISRERMEVYSAAHCIHWNEMLPDYRQVLTAMLLDDFRSVLNPEQR